MTSTEPPPINRESITTLSQAFRVLGIVGDISKQSQINEAFRIKAKAAHQHGGFSGDMDLLTQAKDFLTTALREAQKQSQRDQARKRAQELEQEERARKNANKQRRQQKEEPKKSEKQGVSEPLCLGPAKNQNWEALRTYEREKARAREQARRLWSYQESLKQRCILRNRQHENKQGGEIERMESDAKSSQELAKPQTDTTLQETFQLFQQRRSQLEQTRNQEDELQQALSRLQQKRSRLEQTIQTADILADQLRVLLNTEGTTE